MRREGDPGHRRVLPYAFGALMVTLALVGPGCSGDDSGNSASTSSEGSPALAPAPVPGAAPVELVFDYLGGGSRLIQVYPGVSDSSRDKTPNGEYLTGGMAEAECKTTGRLVRSHPEQHEAERSSDQWIKLDVPSNVVQFATAVYVENPEALLQQLPICG